MKYIVNKKLFEKVMLVDLSHKFNLDNTLESGTESNMDAFFYWNKDAKYFHSDAKTILVNDFFFKCIDWAYKKGYEVFSSKYKSEIQEINPKSYSDFEEFYSENQKQSVFDACEWIYNKIYKE